MFKRNMEKSTLLPSGEVQLTEKWSNAYAISRSRGAGKGEDDVQKKPSKLTGMYHVYLAFALFLIGIVSGILIFDVQYWLILFGFYIDNILDWCNFLLAKGRRSNSHWF